MFNDPLKLAGPRHHLPILGTIALILCAFWVWPACAQDAAGNYKEIREYKAPSRDEERAVADMARNGSISNQQLFEAYYDHKISRLTWRENFGEIAKEITNLKNRNFRITQGAAHGQLVAYVLEWTQRIASDEEIHPFARFNAIKLMGDLNRVEAPPGQGQAQPLPEAIPRILEYIEASDALSVAALMGLRRHAEAGALDGNRKIEVAGKMLELIGDENRHAWIHRRAADLLGVLQLPGTGRNSANVIEALSGMISDKENSASLRATAAGALSQINFDAAPQNVEYASLAEKLTALAVDVGKDSKSLRHLIAQLHRVNEALNGRVVGRAPRGGVPPREGGLVKAAADTPHAEYVQAAGEKVAAMLAPLMDLDSESDSDAVPSGFQEPLTMTEAWLHDNPPEGTIARGPGGD